MKYAQMRPLVVLFSHHCHMEKQSHIVLSLRQSGTQFVPLMYYIQITEISIRFSTKNNNLASFDKPRRLFNKTYSLNSYHLYKKK